MKKIVGVMGPGEQQATEPDLNLAYEIGSTIALFKAATLTGGMTGVMEAAVKGAKESGGTTIGIGPTKSKTDQNQYIDYPLVTGMGPGQNYINAVSYDVLVFVTVNSPGTLSELAHAIQAGTPSIVIGASENLVKFITELSNEVIFVDSLEESYRSS